MSQPKISILVEPLWDSTYRVTVLESGNTRSGFHANEKGEFLGDLSSLAPWSSQSFKIRASVEVMAQMIIQELEKKS
jgi:hypothetical protein